MTARARVARIALCTTALFAVCVMVMSPAARAATAYRYWTYWSVQDGAWHFATLGPASFVPADGAVEGWHFTVTSESGTQEDAPKAPAATAFDEVCGDTAAVAGRKRVALIVDFGMPNDAPPGEHQPVGIAQCVVAEPDATGYQVLSSAADVRVEDGLVCGIDSYPLTECAAVVDPTAMAPPSMTDQLMPSSSGSSSTGPLVSGLTLLVVGGIGYYAWNRRRRS